MTTLSDLHDLRDMLDKATGPSRELDVRLYCALWDTDCRPAIRWPDTVNAHWAAMVPPHFTEADTAQRFTSSIDAAEALRQRLLPGSFIWLQKDRVWECRVVALDGPASEDVCIISEAPTEPLARLKATVAALIAVKDNENEQA